MKQGIERAMAVAFSLAFAGAVQAQTRHVEKPHGTPKTVAAAKNAKQVKQSGNTGRHDERPHGVVRQAPGGTGSK